MVYDIVLPVGFARCLFFFARTRQKTKQRDQLGVPLGIGRPQSVWTSKRQEVKQVKQVKQQSSCCISLHLVR